MTTKEDTVKACAEVGFTYLEQPIDARGMVVCQATRETAPAGRPTCIGDAYHNSDPLLASAARELIILTAQTIAAEEGTCESLPSWR